MMTTQRRTSGARARRLGVAASALALLSLTAPAASATVDRSPNAIPVAAGVCEDGPVSGGWTPNEQSPVGFDVELEHGGVGKSLAIVAVVGPDPLVDHVVLETLYDRPGRGYEKHTVLCAVPFDPDNGIWLVFDFLRPGPDRP